MGITGRVALLFISCFLFFKSSCLSVYCDLTFMDGTKKWGEWVGFTQTKHGWEDVHKVIFPQKPVLNVYFYLLFAGIRGEVVFREPVLRSAL